MAQLMDQSLDDIIRQTDTRGGGGGGGRGYRGGGGRRYGGSGGRRGGGGGDNSYGPIRRRSGGGGGSRFASSSAAPYPTRSMEKDTWDHDLYDQQDGDMDIDAGGRRGNIQSRLGDGGVDSGTKVVVRNLRDTVTNTDIQELFESVGALNRVEVEYDRSGRSIGSAVAFFVKRRDAETAVSKYNGVSLDNQPMEIFIVESSRRGLGFSGSGMRIGTSADGRRRIVVDNRQFDDGPSRRRSYGGSGGRRGGGGGYGRGGRGRGGPGRRDRRTPTKEELDNELTNLTSQQMQSMDINT